MYCSNCGKQIPDNTIYCSECGHKIGEPSYKSDDKVSINNGSSQAGSVQWGSFIDNNFGFLVKKIRAVGGSNLLMIFVIVALLLVSMFVFFADLFEITAEIVRYYDISETFAVFDLIEFGLLKVVTVGIYLFAMAMLVYPFFVDKAWGTRTLTGTRLAVIWTTVFFFITQFMGSAEVKDYVGYEDLLDISISYTIGGWCLLVCNVLIFILTFKLKPSLDYYYWKETYGPEKTEQKTDSILTKVVVQETKVRSSEDINARIARRATTKAPETWKCKKCGKENNIRDLYCKDCGSYK